MLAASPVMAHKVTVFAWVEGGTVHTESKFSGGRQAKGARIEVYNQAGEKLLEGRTDDQGRFDFEPPGPEALRIVLVAGAGHRNEWRLAAEEFDNRPAAEDTGDRPAPQVTAPTAPPARASRNETITLTRAELEELIEAALDKKLAPVVHRLAQLGQGPRLPDIIGGIGYILGLVGLAAYLKARRRSG